jgi:hypothetical protein
MSQNGYQNEGFHNTGKPATSNEFQDYPAPSYESTINRINHPTYQTIPVIQSQVIIVGGCPACGIGILEDGMLCLIDDNKKNYNF